MCQNELISMSSCLNGMNSHLVLAPITSRSSHQIAPRSSPTLCWLRLHCYQAGSFQFHSISTPDSNLWLRRFSIMLLERRSFTLIISSQSPFNWDLLPCSWCADCRRGGNTHRQQRSQKPHRPGAAKINVHGRGRKCNQVLNSVSNVASLHAGSCLTAAGAESREVYQPWYKQGFVPALLGQEQLLSLVLPGLCLVFSLAGEINHKNGMRSFTASSRFPGHDHGPLFWLSCHSLSVPYW